MLITDPKKRATVDQLLDDVWLKSQRTQRPQTPLTTVAEMKKHMALTRLKAAGHAAMAATRMQHMTLS